jgi:hypothetical protein
MSDRSVLISELREDLERFVLLEQVAASVKRRSRSA